MIQKLDQNHINFTDNEGILGRFMDSFGCLDFESGKGI